MKKPAVLFFLLLLGLSLNAQDVGKVKQLLNSGDYPALKKALSGEIETPEDPFILFMLNREVCSGYYETEIMYEIATPFEETDRVADLQSFHLHLLRHEDQIILARMHELNHEGDFLEELHRINEPLELEEMGDHFRQEFRGNLDVDLLLNSKVDYGSSCGRLGKPPEYQEKMLDLVEVKNKQVLEEWLSSSITEVQIYAIDGFDMLRSEGLSPTRKQLMLINRIMIKKGEVRACAGNNYHTRSIKDICRKFRF